MKKQLIAWMLVVAILMAGCTAGMPDASQKMPSTEATTEATVTGTQAEPETTAATETTAPEDTEPEQTEPEDDGLDAYLASIVEQSDSLKASLRDEAMTQAAMNATAQELYDLWDGALNELWGKLQDTLPEDAFDRLLDEQLQWIEDKESAVEAAGKDYEGGSLYPLIVNSEAAAITEARVYELFDLLKQQ